jgi:hypothetical protein
MYLYKNQLSMFKIYGIASLLLFGIFSFGQTIDAKLSKIAGDQFTIISDPSELVRSQNHTRIFYESANYRGDTTGASDGTEFLKFHDFDNYSDKEISRLILNRYVSNFEWIEFENYVRDSIARRLVMENFPKYMSVYGFEDEYEDGTPMVSQEIRLNYKPVLDVKSAEFLPALLNLYFPKHERLSYKDLEFDSRKLVYVYKPILKGEELRAVVNLFTEYFCWAKFSHHQGDIYYRLAEHYRSHTAFSAYPVVGLWEMQTLAFMNWKERKLQSQIDKQKLPYRIQLELPDADEVASVNQSGIKCVSFPETNRTEMWKITNAEYATFLSHVKDSLLRSIFGFETEAGKVFLTPVVDELDSKVMLQMSEWDINYTTRASIPFTSVRLEMFGFGETPMNIAKDKNGNVEYPGGFGFGADVVSDGFHPGRLFYNYLWIDYKRLCDEGLTTWEFNYWADPPYEEKSCADLWNCKDLNLDGYYDEVHTGVRSCEDRSLKIVRDVICVYPNLPVQMCNSVCEHEFQHQYVLPCPKHTSMDSLFYQTIRIYDFKSAPNDLVKNITYDQALAFYHWKFSKYRNETTSIVYNTAVPSEEEFQKIQSGESITTPELIVELPAPAFRYVIHVYK